MRIKKFLSTILITTFALSVSVPISVSAEEIVENAHLTMGSIKIFVNGQRVRKQTLLYNDSTYLPLRALAEALSKEILYDPVTVTAQINSTPVDYPPDESTGDIDTVSTVDATIYLGRTKLMVDGKDVPQETLLYNDSAYAPLRAVAELLNMDVSYDDSIKSAMLYDKGAPVPPTINYLVDFPTVIDLGIFAELPEESIKVSVEAEATKYLYLNVPEDTVNSYIDALTADEFVLEEQTSPGIFNLKKNNVTVTIDRDTYKETNLLLLSIVSIEPFSYPEQFPNIPLFSPERPVQAVLTADERGIVYTYTGISDEKVLAYIEEITRLTFEHNTVLSALDYNVYNLEEFSVTVDTTKQKTENLVVITIRNEIFLFQKEFPTVPTFAGIKPENTTPSEDSKGSVYWYKGATEDIINQYIKELSRLGYVTDAALSQAGYYVYKSGDVTVYIDTNTYRSTGYVLLTVTKEINVVYYPNYPTVPSFPARIETTSQTDDGTGTVYWHLNVTEAAVNEYAEQIARLGFIKDNANSRDGYLVFTKSDVSVTLDSVTRAANGFFVVEIRNIVPMDPANIPFVAYGNYPIVPDIGTFVSPYVQPSGSTFESEYVEALRYDILKNEAIQNYLKYLIDNKFTNIAAESKDGYWVFQKDELILTIDTLTAPGLYTYVKINTANVVKNYQNLAGVPDFRTVVRRYWDIPRERWVDTASGYTYSIREAGDGTVAGYMGDVSLFEAYIEYLDALGFARAAQDEPALVEGETRQDVTYNANGISFTVTESTITAGDGSFTVKISITRN